MTKNSRWRHRKGDIYEVLMVTNTEATKPDTVETVVYRREKDGTLWSRPWSEWDNSFELVSREEAAVEIRGYQPVNTDGTQWTLRPPGDE